MITEYNKLKPLILNLVHNECYKVKDVKMFSEVVEVHLSAPSIVRKKFTINKINNLISKNKLSLKVFELPEMEFSDRFVISKI